MSKINIVISGEGPPLVLLHGWGWDSSIWEALLPRLQAVYQVFAIDLPGCGESPLITKNYSFAEIVPLLLTQLPAQSTWLGWSLGGLFALWTAIHYPSRVSALITLASSPKFIAAVDWPGINIATLEKFSTLLISDPKKTLSDFLELQLRGSPNRDELFCQLNKKIAIENKNSLQGLLGGLDLLKTTDLRASLKNMTCPSLHILGRRDTIVPANIAQLSLATLPKSHCEIIKSAGHMPFLSHPELCLNLLGRVHSSA